MARAKKRTNKVSNIMEKYEIKGMYEGVFKAVERAVAINLCTEYSTLDEVLIVNGDKEIARIDEWEDIFRDIKKVFIKHNLFPVEMTVDKETLVIHTSSDLLSLMYVPYGCTEDEDYYLKELSEIKAEIEQEQKDIEEAEATTWNEMYERELEEHKAEHTIVCPKCGGVARNEAPNGAGILEECDWYCTSCNWVKEDIESVVFW